MGTQEENVVKIAVTLEERDYRNFNFHHMGKGLTWFGIGYLGIVALFIIITPYPSNRALLVSLAATVPFVIVSLLMFVGVFYLIVFIATKRVFKSDKLIQRGQQYTIADAGIQVETSAGSARVSWDDAFKASESKHIFAIYIARNKAFIIPKRCMELDKQIELRGLLKRVLGGKKGKGLYA